MSYTNYKKAPGERPQRAVSARKVESHHEPPALVHQRVAGLGATASPPGPTGTGTPLRKVRWGAAVLWEGEPALLLAEVLPAAVPDGTPVKFRVYEAKAQGRGKEVKALEGKAKAGLARAAWSWTHEPAAADEADGKAPYEPPRFLFEAEAKGAKLEAPPRPVKGRLSLEVVDEDGTPLAGMTAALTLADGTERSLPLDEEGKAELKPLPPGSVKLTVPG